MLTSRLADFVYRMRINDLPADVVDRAQKHVYDTIGVIIAGSGQPMGKLISRHVATVGGNPVASVFGHGFKTSACQAALANGTMAHILDFDDDSDTIYSHPSSTLLPAVLALGEPEASGAEILTAYVVGEEVSARIARVAGLLPGHYERGWHATSTLGVMGASAASAKILRLDRHRIRFALGIAASEASGIQTNFGTMTKSLHAGSAAAKAVNAALFAETGITANPGALESPAGFLEVFGGDTKSDFEALTADLGEHWDFITPGVNIKRYPSCYYTHAAIDLLLELMAENGFEHGEIASIRCGISPVAAKVLRSSMPDDALGLKFHLPYCLAVAACQGTVAVPHFEGTYGLNADIQRLMDCVHVETIPEIGSDGLGLGSRIAVATRTHGTLTRSKSKPRGGGQAPLTWEEIGAKFAACVEGRMRGETAAFIENSVRRFTHLNNVSELLSAACRLEIAGEFSSHGF